MVTFKVGDLVLVDAHALRGAQDGDQSKKFAKRWLGPFAVLSQPNALAYVIDLPADWKCHRTINIGFLKSFKESADYPRTMTRRRTVRTAADRVAQDTEVLEVRTVTRRGGRQRKEFLVKWPGERHPQWISEEQLREAVPQDDLPAILGSAVDNTSGSGVSATAADAPISC